MNANGWQRWRWFRLATAALVLALVAGAGASTQTRADDAGVAPTAVSADDAIRQQVEQNGGVYAGDCASTRSPEDVGKICSKLVAERDSERAYLTGRTFSEFDTWVFVQQTPAGWNVAATAPLDFFDTTGTIPWP